MKHLVTRHLSEQLDRARTENDLIGFDENNTKHWYAALKQMLDVELEFHIPEDDLQVVRAILYLMRECDKCSSRSWKEFTASLGATPPVEPPPEPVVQLHPQPRKRKARTSRNRPPPPHGTISRYGSPKYKCRCDACRQARSEYLRKRKQASQQ